VQHQKQPYKINHQQDIPVVPECKKNQPNILQTPIVQIINHTNNAHK
jgi:hypothetical protein